MKTSSFKVGSAFSLLVASTLMMACGAGDMYDVDGAQEGALESDVEDSDSLELGTIEQALHSCATPDGTNAVMAALAVATGQELKRWRAGLDFEFATDRIRLTSGTGSDGKPRGKSRCSGGVCPRTEALLALQNDTATGVYIQAESSTTRVLVNPSALRSRMYAKLQEQIAKDVDAKDGDTYQSPKTPHTLSGVGTASLGGCGPHYKFSVAFDSSSTSPKPAPVQLKWALSFADQQNGWVDFRDLGNNVVGVDPTGGLNEEDTSSSGSCPAVCTKISTTDVSNGCCSCGGVSKKFKRSTFNTNTYLCQ
ncbi:MAG TPA: hypothetical protein VMG12_30610 [Polyangiaceae bacterium]|nr:hypothetical protein [Polyangiaceae bacterium]